jgi:hypothetical protein
MNTKAIIGVSILVVVFIVLCSQTSVVGYRVVKDSQESLIKESISKMEKVKTNFFRLKSMFTRGNIIKVLLQIFYAIIFIIGFVFGIVTWIPAFIISTLFFIFYGLCMIRDGFINALLPLVIIPWFLLSFGYPVVCGALLVSLIQSFGEFPGPWRQVTRSSHLSNPF